MEIYKNLLLEDLNGEIWKEIDGYGGDYFVSNFGRIKSFKKHNGINVKILKLGKYKTGYLYIDLCKNSKNNKKNIHRLVLETFNPIENMKNLQVNHKKGIKSDNRLSELEWCTCSGNIKHAFKIGLRNIKGENHPMFGKHHSEKAKELMSINRKNKYSGENHPRSKLTEKKVIEIWKDLNEGILTQKQIAKKFGVKRVTITNIKTNKTWKYLYFNKWS